MNIITEQMERNLKNKLMNASWVCHKCGQKYGSQPENHIATYHMDTCDVCDDYTMVTEPRDYRYFRDTLNPRNKQDDKN